MQSEPKHYRFADDNLPWAADSLSYRLVQVDTDGKTSITYPIVVARGGPEQLRLKEAFPNPVKSQVTVRYAVPREPGGVDADLRIFDVLGREVHAIGNPTRRAKNLHLLAAQWADRLGSSSETGLASGEWKTHVKPRWLRMEGRITHEG